MQRPLGHERAQKAWEDARVAAAWWRGKKILTEMETVVRMWIFFYNQ